MAGVKHQAAIEAAAAGGTIAEIAEAMGESSETIAEWIAAEPKRQDVDPWDMVQDLVTDARRQMSAAVASGDHAAAKSLAATLGRLAPVLARLEEGRREDGVRILPQEIAAAEDRVRKLVKDALRGEKG